MIDKLYSTSLCCALSIALLSSCVTAPDYSASQSTQTIKNYSKTFKRAGANTDPVPPVAHWWAQLNDPVLTKLIEDGLSNSPDVKIAIARISRSRAVAAEQNANRKPTVAASAIAIQAPFSRSNPITGGGNAGNAPSPDDDYYNIGINTSWEIDLFGGARASAQAAIADTQAVQAELSDVQVSLSSQIAATYIEFRHWQNQERILQDIVSLSAEKLRLENARVRFGTASELSLAAMKAEISRERSELAVISGEQLATADRLALLTGATPGSLDDKLITVLPVPLPPREVSVGDPASLLQRRPDIRAAKKRLASANARIGVANAQRFPSVSFFGLLGLGGSNPADIVDSGNLSTLLLPRINWSFLDFGRVNARIDQAEAGASEAAANFDKIVFTALSETEQSLAQFGAQRSRVLETANILQADKNAENLTQARFRRGTASRITEIDAALKKFRSEKALLSATADMTKGYIIIQKNLGLGWSESK